MRSDATRVSRRGFLGAGAAGVTLAAFPSWLARASTQVVHLTADCGAVGDGSADDTQALLDFADALKTYGGLGIIGPGVFRTTEPFEINGAQYPFSIKGAGMYGQSKIVRDYTDDISLFRIWNSNDVYLADFSLDANARGTSGTGHHGLSVNNCSYGLAERIFAFDARHAQISVRSDYDHTHKRWVLRGCRADGFDTANNGIYLNRMDMSGIENCRSENAKGQPGYGLQLKNSCTESWILDSWSRQNRVNLALGSDGTDWATRCMLANLMLIKPTHIQKNYGSASGNYISDIQELA